MSFRPSYVIPLVMANRDEQDSANGGETRKPDAEERRIHHERKLKHLELLQNEVGRFTSESLRIKTTIIPIILVAAGLAIDIGAPGFDLVVLFLVVPVLLVWFLDAYFVKRQRCFRARYNHVRQLPEGNEITLEMCEILPQSASKPTLGAAFWFREQSAYYLTLLAVILLGACYVHQFQSSREDRKAQVRIDAKTVAIDSTGTLLGTRR